MLHNRQFFLFFKSSMDKNTHKVHKDNPNKPIEKACTKITKQQYPNQISNKVTSVISAPCIRKHSKSFHHAPYYHLPHYYYSPSSLFSILSYPKLNTSYHFIVIPKKQRWFKHPSQFIVFFQTPMLFCGRLKIQKPVPHLYPPHTPLQTHSSILPKLNTTQFPHLIIHRPIDDVRKKLVFTFRDGIDE